MIEFIFISRHVPTPEQHALAAELGITLRHVGDRDAFAVTIDELNDLGGVGAIVVHPALALKCRLSGLLVGVYENANRAPEGAKPEFFARALHVYWRKGEIISAEQLAVASRDFYDD